jgi:hypothetical protein
MTPRPRIIDNLGDTDPIANGGYFIWSDGSAEWLEEPPDDADEQHQEWTVYRFDLDRFGLVINDDGTWSLVPREWFQDSLTAIARCSDYPDGVDGLRKDLCSPDIRERAWAYRDIGMYHGFVNLDSYPLTLTRAEVNARYRSVLRTLARRRQDTFKSWTGLHAPGGPLGPRPDSQTA